VRQPTTVHAFGEAEQLPARIVHVGRLLIPQRSCRSVASEKGRR
jgi:hypothetical protein